MKQMKFGVCSRIFPTHTHTNTHKNTKHKTQTNSEKKCIKQKKKVGPPYMMTVKDWRLVSQKWEELTPIIFKNHEPWPSILGEMYGYCVASMYYGLRHKIVTSLMVSNVEMTNDEGWDQCNIMDLKNMNNLTKYNENKQPQPGVTILHYCQGFWIGPGYYQSSPRYAGFNFHKGHIPKNILNECTLPLFYPAPTSNLGIYFILSLGYTFECGVCIL